VIHGPAQRKAGFKGVNRPERHDAMIFSFGGGSGPQLRAMEPGYLRAVLHIISAHDEDDFEEAHAELRDDLEGMFVLTERGKVVGVAGAHIGPQ
jgi:hypothetical protein